MYLPWIHRIYIVIADNQPLPSWLKEHGKLRIIRHSQIFTKEYVNPVYNSVTIESAIHRIPGLSELFIYSNDDCFFNHPLRREDFFVENKPLGWFDTNMTLDVNQNYEKIHDIMERNAIAHTNNIIQYRNISPLHPELLSCRVNHFQKALSKDMIKDFMKHEDPIKETYRARFRNEKCMYTLSGVTNLGIQTGRCYYSKIPPNYFANLNKDSNILNNIATTNPHLICFNNSKPEDKQKMHKIFETLYPKPSKFELEVL